MIYIADDSNSLTVQPQYVAPDEIECILIKVAHIIKGARKKCPGQRLRNLQYCKRVLSKAHKLCDSASNPNDLAHQKLGIQSLLGKSFYDSAEAHFNRQQVGEPGESLQRSLDELRHAQEAFEAALHLNPRHVKTMARLMHTHVGLALSAPAGSEETFLNRGYALLRRAKKTRGQSELPPKVRVAEADLRFSEGYLFPDLKKDAVDAGCALLKRASDLSPKVRENAARVCQRYFGKPDIPGKKLAQAKFGEMTPTFFR